MAKIPSFPLIFIAPIVAVELVKQPVKTHRSRPATAPSLKLYFALVSLLLLAFFIIIYFGWLNWLVALGFILGCVLLNSYYIFKVFSQSSSGEIVRTKPIDWNLILSNRVMQPTSSSTAPGGCSEDFFSVYLQKYFDGIIFAGESFPIPNSTFQYSSDFSIVLPDGLSIIIEIDEPYYYKDGTPTHCIDRSKDSDRNKFFLAGGWSIIRFAEEQIVINPEGCCLEIARLLVQLTRDRQYLARFSAGVAPLGEIRCWSYSEAEIMAHGKYRDRYLIKSGIKQGVAR
jgi:Protein of unknown function (DUF559)